MPDFERVTTRGGDKGESSLYDGTRLRKDDLLFETMGDIDELTSFLGYARASLAGEKRLDRTIREVQQDLLKIGAMISTSPESELHAKITLLERRDLDRLEQRERKLLDRTEISDRFVLPGETGEAARFDICRTICRRAERKVVRCIRDRSLGHLAICQNYLNRLSDYLFILARALS